MRLTTRQTGVISYAGLDEQALWEGAKRAFALADEAPPERFRSFVPLFPVELIVNMSYVGRKRPASPSGFSIDPGEYHQKLYAERPELYTGDNRLRLLDVSGRFHPEAPITVDGAWAEVFPQYRPFLGEKLMIHMIGGGHQAVAVPESIFPRSGGVLCGAEQELGIVEKCRQFAQYVRERIEAGEPYDPVRFEEAYLAQTGFAAVCIRQQDLSRAMQELCIIRDLNGAPKGSDELFTESSRLAEGIPQYVPFRRACDVFEPIPLTRATMKLVQLHFSRDRFISDLWLPYTAACEYLDKRRMALDVHALCEGFQLGPASDADTRGGCYPDYARVVTVVDRSLRPLAADTVNNPAYGSGLSPTGLFNRLIYLPGSRQLIEEGRLQEEPLPFVCEHTHISEESYLHMRDLAELQEYKGRLIDALYRRESALKQMIPGTPAYERARSLLDAKVDRAQRMVQRRDTNYCQPSGYDADIAYLYRMAQSRMGLPDEADAAPFTADPLRDQSIESGYAMRTAAQSASLKELRARSPHEDEPAAPPVRSFSQTAGGLWFEQMDMFSAIETTEHPTKD